MDLSDPHQIIGKRCIEIKETDSTNAHLAMLDLKEMLVDGTTLFASYQTSGRGQFSKSWHSEPGQNILTSILLKPKDWKADRLFQLNIAVTLGLFDLLSSEFPGRVKIKWSNDILVDEKKIAGILIENQIGSTYLSRSIVGIGLNINQTAFGPELPLATSVKLLSGMEQHIETWKKKLLKHINLYYIRLLNGWSDLDEKKYIQNLYGFGEWKLWVTPDGTFEALVQGVDNTGQLILITREGSISLWSPGSLKPASFIP